MVQRYAAPTCEPGAPAFARRVPGADPRYSRRVARPFADKVGATGGGGSRAWTSRSGRCSPSPTGAGPPARHRPPGRERRGARAHPARPTGRRSHYGADGVECDVRLTADHHLVCVHDRRVEPHLATAPGWSPRSSWPPSRSSTGPRGSSAAARATPSPRVRPRARAPADPAPPARHPRRHPPGGRHPHRDQAPDPARQRRREDARAGAACVRPRRRRPARAPARADDVVLATARCSGPTSWRPTLPLVYLVDADAAGADLGRHPAQGHRRGRARRADAAPRPKAVKAFQRRGPPGLRLDRRPTTTTSTAASSWASTSSSPTVPATSFARWPDPD